MNKHLEATKPTNGTPKSVDTSPIQQNSGAQTALTSITSFSGPIPPPIFLKEYENLVPGSAKKFLEQPHLEAEHRRLLEKTMVEGQIASSKRGQWMAFFLAIICILGAFSAIFYGYDLAGLGALVLSIGSLIGVFIFAKYENRGQ